jgi:hypothetical protein
MTCRAYLPILEIKSTTYEVGLYHKIFRPPSEHICTGSLGRLDTHTDALDLIYRISMLSKMFGRPRNKTKDDY